MSHDYTTILMGPLAGARLGFFITLSKTPPRILIDSFYGAFLGLLFTVAYTLFVLSACSKEENVAQESEDLTKIKRVLAQLRELDQDRERLRKARVSDPSAPIATRTRSQT